MYFYKAYGLKIQSELCLPQLLVIGETEPDIFIKSGKVEIPSSEDNFGEYGFYFTEQEAYFYWGKIGSFLVREGKEIIVQPAPEVEEQLLHLPLLGTILAVLLHQRQILVLHSSAVATEKGVLAFLGDKGQGKSTMAATLYSRGHQLVADDLVALDLSNPTTPRVLPGFPQFKLWPEAAASIGDDPETLPKLFSGYEKRARRAEERFADMPLPLISIFVLSSGSEPLLKPIPLQEGVLKLVANSYVTRYGNRLLQGANGSRHLAQCSTLINNVPIYYLERPRSLELMPKIAEMVENNAV
jgi:hypothetical protein